MFVRLLLDVRVHHIQDMLALEKEKRRDDEGEAKRRYLFVWQSSEKQKRTFMCCRVYTHFVSVAVTVSILHRLKDKALDCFLCSGKLHF